MQLQAFNLLHDILPTHLIHVLRIISVAKTESKDL